MRYREMLLTHKDILLKLEKIEQTLSGHDDKILLIFEYLKQLEHNKRQDKQAQRKRIGFRPDD